MLQIKSFDERIAKITLTMSSNRLLIDFICGATLFRCSNDSVKS